MIGWLEVYKVVEDMVPLYAALALGYGSVRWLKIFTPDHCDGIHKLVSFFILPLFTFELALHIDPFTMNFRLIAADAITKGLIVIVLFAWAKFCPKGSFDWSITSFSLSSLTSSLVVGVPMLKSMYGPSSSDLVVQLSVVQAIVWLTLLLFVLEVRKTTSDLIASQSSPPDHVTSVGDVDADVDFDLEKENNVNGKGLVGIGRLHLFWSITKTVLMKLATNPNSYACFLGIAWAFVANSNRWHIKMPMIIEGCVLIISKSGTGMSMFSMGLSMASQEKLICCGPSLTVYGMVLKFVAGPAVMAIGSFAVGLRGDVLKVAIIQAALPQSITSFIFARDYGLHADVLSTAVTFGTMVSLPFLVVYYFALELIMKSPSLIG